MAGPYEVGDKTGVYFEWNCSKCGHVCQRFRWEYTLPTPGEGRQMSGPAWWKDDKKWRELMDRLNAGGRL